LFVLLLQVKENEKRFIGIILEKSFKLNFFLNHNLFIFKVPIIFTTKTNNIMPLTSSPQIPTETHSTSEVTPVPMTSTLTAS